MNENQNQLAQQPQERALTYQSAGVDVTLTKGIVRKILCKGDPDVFGDEHINQFMLMCQFNQLNPFLGEAVLTGYKNKMGGSDVSMIVTKEAFFKRAEACPQYAGIQAGVIVKRGGEILELEGNWFDDTDILVGGWAKVYRTDRKMPVVSKVRLCEYDKNRATWNSMKSTMIAKVAKVQALREAFPSQLGAIYTQEERIPIEEADAQEILDTEKHEKANKERVDFAPEAPVQSEKPSVSNNEPGF